MTATPSKDRDAIQHRDAVRTNTATPSAPTRRRPSPPVRDALRPQVDKMFPGRKRGPSKPPRRGPELPFTPHEEQRLARCMQNSSRLQQLGLPDYEFRRLVATFQDKDARNQRNIEDSESEYFQDKNAKFDIDTSDEAVRNGCLEMMKSAVRQRRHKLKKKYFDPFPLHLVRKTSPIPKTSDEQWLALLDSWTTPKKMETCQKNKDNRGKVMFPHGTGSCSYEVHVENVRSKHGDKELDALDLFKECHYSNKKKGFPPAVQAAITEMEIQLVTTREGEHPKSATQVVDDVLHMNIKHSRFLQNVGIKTRQYRSSVQNVRAELQAEKRANTELREQVNVLLREQAETKKKQYELEAKLELLLSRSQLS